MNDLTKQQIRKYKIDRVRLIKGSKHSMYIHEDILIPIIMQSRLSDSKTIKFRTDLGFNQINLILKKEQSVIESIRDTFKGEDIRIQYTVLGYRIDLYFYEYKLAIEIDELGHNDRNTNYEIKRQRAIEKELIVYLLELILMLQILTWIDSKTKYPSTLLNQKKKN